MALGYTLQMPEEDRYLKTRNEILDELAVFMGGRVAEEIFCDDITTGASNDLERSTKMAREMVTRYGFSEALGTQVYGQANHQVFLGRDYADHQDYSEATAERIDTEVNRIMQEAHDRAYNILIERKDQVEQMVRVVLERETVEGEEVKALLNNTWDEYMASHPELQQRSSSDASEDTAKNNESQEGDASTSHVVASEQAHNDESGALDAGDAQLDATEPAEKNHTSSMVVNDGAKELRVHDDGRVVVYDHQTDTSVELGPLEKK